MNEMLYGNTGRRDEGINIDLDQALYQKLQSRTFVPKLKSMLNDRLQEGDKNFVFIGEVVDKLGKFSVYGYNAKLESDSRGGDYGHYLVKPLNEKVVEVDMDNVEFLTEEGFVEYVNLKTLNDEKRFKISSMPVEIDVNAKKRIVNNLMETFMKVRKRKNVTFSFDDCSVEEFSAKSLFVLLDLMKYLPYRMRKNISFISHVASNQKLPDMINLAAYPAQSEYVPHDCISLSAATFGMNDGAFAGYVEKVFSMSDAEREQYFEMLYNEIEVPASEKNLEVKSDLYLLDVETKNLWLNGDVAESLANIFASVDEILSVFPIYKELAKQRVVACPEDVVSHVRNRIIDTNTLKDLKAVYNNVSALFQVCELEMVDTILDMFKLSANSYFETAMTSEKSFSVAEKIVAIDPMILNQEVAKNNFRTTMLAEADMNAMYAFYLKLKDKKFIEPQELNLCLEECLEAKIVEETNVCEKAKDKLAILERLYSDFKASCEANDYSRVKEVYEKYKDKYMSNAKNEALGAGQEIIYGIEREHRGHCTFLDLKNQIVQLAEIEVQLSEDLKNRTSQAYRNVVKKMYVELDHNNLGYADFKKLIGELSPAVKLLEDNGVYDEYLRSGWGDEKYVPDGMYRFVLLFESLIKKLESDSSLTTVLVTFEKMRNAIKEEETQLRSFFEKYGSNVLYQWLAKNPKMASEKSLKKAEKEMKKKHDTRLSEKTKKAFAKFKEYQKKNRKKKKPSAIKVILTIVLILAIVTGAGFGGYVLYKKFLKPEQTKPQPIEKVEKITMKQEAKEMIEEYLKGFDMESEYKSAELVLGTIRKDKESKDTYVVTIKDSLKSKLNKEIKITEGKPRENAKDFYSIKNVKENMDYAIVLQEGAESGNVYIRDIFEIPLDLKESKFEVKKFDEKIFKDEEGKVFYANLLKYIGYKQDVVEVEEPKKTTEEGTVNEQKTPQKGEGKDSGKDSDKKKSDDSKSKKK